MMMQGIIGQILVLYLLRLIFVSRADAGGAGRAGSTGKDEKPVHRGDSSSPPCKSHKRAAPDSPFEGIMIWSEKGRGEARVVGNDRACACVLLVMHLWAFVFLVVHLCVQVEQR